MKIWLNAALNFITLTAPVTSKNYDLSIQSQQQHGTKTLDITVATAL